MLHRLAVVAAIALALTLAILPAASGDECVLTPDGIECHFEGTTTSIATEWEYEELPPFRYLRIYEDVCWYWSRWPPGIDAWDSANDTLVVLTIWRLEECVWTDPDPVEYTEEEVISRAWEIFRSFPLAGPTINMQPPDAGITGLPSYASAWTPAPLGHSETLPDGTRLQVQARVDQVLLDWGDETPLEVEAPGAFLPWPDGEVGHTFLLKTCPPEYRREHPSGPNCHPTLEAYPITASFVWRASYAHDGVWHDLGTLARSTTIHYDVDEAVGILK